MADRQRFELWIRQNRTPVFKTGAFNHSAICPHRTVKSVFLFASKFNFFDVECLCCAARGHALAVCHLLAFLVGQTRSAPHQKKSPTNNLLPVSDLFNKLFFRNFNSKKMYIIISFHIFHYFDDIAAVFLICIRNIYCLIKMFNGVIITNFCFLLFCRGCI